uniref:Thylakoid lumenal 15.0 kDa protein 2ic n=1 Tax=Rhizophora mucronata TaxID=61149 RepID=A0A2P2KAD9_RHIMU
MAFLCFPSPLWNTPRPAFMPPITGSVPPVPKSIRFRNWVLDFHSKSSNFMLSGALALCLSFSGIGLAEAKVGVNKPELLPKEFTTVIDVAGFLSDGQVRFLASRTMIYVFTTVCPFDQLHTASGRILPYVKFGL